MFTADPNITDADIKEKTLSKVFFSMNIHQVATPELSVEDARCYLFFAREGNRFSSYIALYLPRSDRKFYYSCSSNPFPGEGLSEIENEAKGFVEDMGFVLDEISFAGMSLDEKARWINEQEMFMQKKPDVASTAAASPAARPTAAPTRPAAPAVGEWKPPAAAGPSPVLPPGAPKAAARPAAAPSQAEAAKPQPKKETRSVTSVVSRDREALAHLLASF